MAVGGEGDMAVGGEDDMAVVAVHTGVFMLMSTTVAVVAAHLSPVRLWAPLSWRLAPDTLTFLPVAPVMTTMGDRTTIAAQSIINPYTMAPEWSMWLLSIPLDLSFF